MDRTMPSGIYHSKELSQPSTKTHDLATNDILVIYLIVSYIVVGVALFLEEGTK